MDESGMVLDEASLGFIVICSDGYRGSAHLLLFLPGIFEGSK
jgi:hypothetical protein